jgi:hypothetical protein
MMSTNDDHNERRHHEIAAAPYAILTRDIGGFSGPPSDGANGARGGALGSVATKALQDVLGWKVSTGDSKGFMNALNQAFELTMFEGAVQFKWTPRSYAVQTDLSGGISGAQASIYTMAKTILDQALPLLEGLRPLKPDSDAEYVAVIRELARSQITELVSELGMRGGPRVVRVNQYFQMLIAVSVDTDMVAQGNVQNIPVDPNTVGGTLGNLRDEMGLRAIGANCKPSYVNSVSDEQDVTNFRIIVDYVNAILNSWTNNIGFFMTMKSPFLGTQLVWISRQLGVVSEAVDEIRFVLDSVFFGPAERETLPLTGLTDKENHKLPEIMLESLLSWIQSFVTSEGPDIIQAGGRFGIGEDFQQMVDQLYRYAHALAHFAKHSDPPIGTERVVFALRKLARQLDRLSQMARSVGITELPDSEDPEDRASGPTPDPGSPPPTSPPKAAAKRPNRSAASSR